MLLTLAPPVQLIILVPHMELGVQTALLIFKMYGGNLSQGRPGDPANMFTYFGPKGIKVLFWAVRAGACTLQTAATPLSMHISMTIFSTDALSKPNSSRNWTGMCSKDCFGLVTVCWQPGHLKPPPVPAFCSAIVPGLS